MLTSWSLVKHTQSLFELPGDSQIISLLTAGKPNAAFSQEQSSPKETTLSGCSKTPKS